MTAREIISYMPPGVRSEAQRISESYTSFFDVLSEIRLRGRGCSSFVIGNKNIPLETKVTYQQIEGLIKSFSHGSIYAYRDSMLDGYIMLSDGVRVGVCGRARYEGRKMLGVEQVSSVCIRIPHLIPGIEETAYRAFSERGGGLIIYSPPGVGKTTLLRALAHRLSSGRDAKRVVVVDERDEFSLGEYFGDSMTDILIGYPKGEGVEVALRTLSPQIIITDEIGDTSEAMQLLKTVNAGVPLIASAHASSFEEAMRKKSVRLLVEAGVFNSAIGIIRSKDNIYSYVCDRIHI